MRLLSIDPATRTGWAWGDSEVRHSGVWDLSVRKDESSGMRLIRFEGKVLEIHRTLGIDVVAFETPSVARGLKANMDGLKLGTKLQAILERLAESETFECKGYNLQTIKSHARARKKEEMVATAQRKWPDIVIEGDDQADALWLWDLANTELAGAAR